MIRIKGRHFIQREQFMTRKEPGSPFLKNASEILFSCLNKPLTLEQREKLAIELAANMLREANRIMTGAEKRRQAELARMMRDPTGKVFTTSMTDQCFRSRKSRRVADQ